MSPVAWKELVGCAITGTGRQAPAAPPGFSEPDDREGAALAAAAVGGVVLRAGAIPSTVGPALVQECEAEEAPVGNEGAEHLRRCIDFGPEMTWLWLRTAMEERVFAPHEVLPQLLNFAKRDRAQARRVLPALGWRGRWLAALNPDWAYAAPDPPVPDEPTAVEEAWATGDLDVRVRLLRQVRQEDPARGRALVESVYAELRTHEREELLKALHDGIGIADEPFLLACLEDRSLPFREAVMEALSLVPEGEAVRGAEEVLFAHIELGGSGRGRKLEVALPEVPEDGQEGWHMRLYKAWGRLFRPGLGWRESFLIRLVGIVPPARWTQRLGEDAGELIRLARKSEHRRALLTGWGLATRRNGDVGWAEELVREQLQKPWESSWEDVPRQLLTDERLEALTFENVGKEGRHEREAILRSLSRWSPVTSRRMLRELAEGRRTDVDATEAVIHFALQLAPEVEAEALAFVSPENEHRFGIWREILPLRREMQETIRRCAGR